MWDGSDDAALLFRVAEMARMTQEEDGAFPPIRVFLHAIKACSSATGQTIFEHNPTEDQWWVNGFDPKGQGTSYRDLEATTVMDFSNNPEFYGSFKAEWDGKNTQLRFDDSTKKVTLRW